jgi:hypothetical protein
MAAHGPLNAFLFDISLIEIGQEIKLLVHLKKFESPCIFCHYLPIFTVAIKKFWSSMSFQNLAGLSQIKNFSLPVYAHGNKVSKN